MTANVRYSIIFTLSLSAITCLFVFHYEMSENLCEKSRCEISAIWLLESRERIHQWLNCYFVGYKLNLEHRKSGLNAVFSKHSPSLDTLCIFVAFHAARSILSIAQQKEEHTLHMEVYQQGNYHTCAYDTEYYRSWKGHLYQ